MNGVSGTNIHLRHGAIILVIVCALVWLFPSVSAEAGFWQKFQQKCGSLFRKPSKFREEKLVLPNIVRREILYAPPRYIQMWRHELRSINLDYRLRFFIQQIETQAQYELLKRMAGIELHDLEVEWVSKYFKRFVFVEQAACFTQGIGKGRGEYPTDFDERLVTSIFEIRNREQFALFTSAKLSVPPGHDNYFREQGIPRVATIFQQEALELVIKSGRALEHDIVNLGLLVENPFQLKAFEDGLEGGFSLREMKSLLKVTNESRYQAFRRSLAKIKEASAEQIAPSEKIASNDNPEFWVSTSGFMIVRGFPEETWMTVKMSEKNRVTSTYSPSNFPLALSDDAWLRAGQLRSQRLLAKKTNGFAYSIFNRESRRRGKFESDFIFYLKDEDRVLPYERITTFEINNTDNEIIGVFGLFDGAPIEGFVDDALPFVRKRPQLRIKFREQLRAWEEEFGKPPRIFEVRRLALHPKATQVDLETVVRIIRKRLDAMGILDESVIIAHTDRSGNAIFQRKAKMHPLYEIEDEYVLFARAGDDWKEF